MRGDCGRSHRNINSNVVPVALSMDIDNDKWFDLVDQLDRLEKALNVLLIRKSRKLLTTEVQLTDREIAMLDKIDI